MTDSFTGISLVIPVYNEEESLPELYRRLCSVVDHLDMPAEIVFVDDGSRDRSAAIIRGLNVSDPRVRLVQLSRNFGHQVAVTAGLDFARGAATVVLDADLQDPPELIPEMIAKWRSGCQIVYGVRSTRNHEPKLMTGARKAYYRFLSRVGELNIPVDAGDFRLIDRRALHAVRGLREYNRYIRGLCSWVGFTQGEVAYDRPGRHAGESKYNLGRLFKLALNGITSFSRWPLHMLLYVGLSMAAFSFVCGVGALVIKLIKPEVIEGWTSMMIFVSFFCGVQLFAMGVMADYIGRIYDEVKNRPIYVVDQLIGFHGYVPAVSRMIYDPPAAEQGDR